MFHPNQGQDTKLYDTLGVSKQSNADEIKKAYRKLAMKYHPDRSKGKSEEEQKTHEEKFKEISAAYDILGDADKRKKYDQFGLDGVKMEGGFGPGGPNINPFDMFGNLFGGHGGMNRGRQQVKKGQDRIEVVHITLEDIYTQTEKIIQFKRNIKCDNCDGKGGSKLVTCSICDGKGMILKIQQMGPGFISQSQQPCTKCKQRGKIIPEDSICEKCNGTCCIKTIQKLKLKLSLSSKNGEKICLQGKSHYNPNVDIQGDLIIVLNILKHSTFTIKDYNLVKKENITLEDALCGIKRSVLLPNNKTVWYQLNNVIKPNDTYIIPDKGLKDKTGVIGNIILEFHIEFPDVIDKERKTYISKILRKYNPVPSKNQEVFEEKNEIQILPWLKQKKNNGTTDEQQDYHHSHFQSTTNDDHPFSSFNEPMDGPIECNQQ